MSIDMQKTREEVEKPNKIQSQTRMKKKIYMGMLTQSTGEMIVCALC